MKPWCEFYVRHGKLFGFLYCAVPVLIWFGITFTTVPFRSVYLLRLVLSLVIGGYFAARANEFGLELWLLKHRSAAGPATVADGAAIGAGIALGCCLFPPLTALIASHHLEDAKSFVILCWLVAVAIGGINGCLLAAVGRRHLPAGGAPESKA